MLNSLNLWSHGLQVCTMNHLVLCLQVFEYFATEVRDGVRYMDARGVVRALVPTYPPHDSTVERAGYLDGASSKLQAGIRHPASASQGPLLVSCKIACMLWLCSVPGVWLFASRLLDLHQSHACTHCPSVPQGSMWQSWRHEPRRHPSSSTLTRMGMALYPLLSLYW